MIYSQTKEMAIRMKNFETQQQGTHERLERACVEVNSLKERTRIEKLALTRNNASEHELKSNLSKRVELLSPD